MSNDSALFSFNAEVTNYTGTLNSIGSDGIRMRFIHDDMVNNEKFNLAIQRFPNQSVAGDNFVMTLGSNAGLNAGVDDPAMPAIFDQWEQNFNQGGPVQNGPDLQERHWVARGTDGIERRPITTAVPRAGGVPGQSTSMRFEQLYYLDWITGAQIYGYDGAGSHIYASGQRFCSNGNNQPFMMMKSADLSQFLPLPYIDSTNCVKSERQVTLLDGTGTGIPIVPNIVGVRALVYGKAAVENNDTLLHLQGENTLANGKVFLFNLRASALFTEAYLTNAKSGGYTNFIMEAGAGATAAFELRVAAATKFSVGAKESVITFGLDAYGENPVLTFDRTTKAASFGGLLKLPVIATGDLPAAASAGAGAIQPVSNWLGGVQALAVSDGTAWRTGYNAAAPARTSLQLTSAQSITSLVATAISWNTTALIDEVGAFDPAHPEYVTAPAGASFVRVSAQSAWSPNLVGSREIRILIGSATVASDSGLSSLSSQRMIATRWLPVAPGDKVQLQVLQDSGIALDFSQATGLAAGIEFEWR